MPTAKKVLISSEEVTEQLLGYIRSGAFPHVAAEAAGVSLKEFNSWLRRGRRPKAREPYRLFVREVRKAVALARLKAEIEARDLDPRFWLTRGPGRETPMAPGWTTQVKSNWQSPEETGYLLASSEWRELARLILKALEPFPDARLAIAAALEQEKTTIAKRDAEKNPY